MSGLKFGGAVGVPLAIMKKRLAYIPQMALFFGFANMAFHGTSAFFRNEI
jgi:hypothetical protein